MIQRLQISGFEVSDVENFNDSIVFTDSRKCFLFNKKNGHILLFSYEYLKEVLSKNMSPSFIRKLKSRGFINKIPQNLNFECKILPEFFMVDMTNQCNMHCKYCLRNIALGGEPISKKIIVDICEYINCYCEDVNLRDVSIQPWGGEPLLEIDNILLMRQLIKPNKTRVHFSIETNGTLLTQEIIKKLYENRIGVGISIDGFAEVHDGQRVDITGSGTHKIVEKNFFETKKIFGDGIGTITTLTKKNAGYAEDILEYFACHLGLKTVKFNYVHQSMFYDCAELCLTADEIADTEIKVLHKLIELNKRGYEISEHNIATKISNLLYCNYLDICHSRGCCGGRKMIVFDRQGNIYPCEMTDTPSESIGNIYNGESLIALVRKAVESREYFQPKRNDDCSVCDWFVFCRGGCTVRVISMGKKPPNIDEIECSVNKVLYPALVELIIEDSEAVNMLLGEEAVKIDKKGVWRC